jgi:hypothetical protein
MTGRVIGSLGVLLGLFATSARADEGMWRFDAIPTQKIAAATGFTPSKAWLERVQSSTVRYLSAGCSGSFVSSTGLIATNYHCVSQCLDKLSQERPDTRTNGFLATTLSDEKKCVGAADVTILTQDVTARVLAAGGPTNSAAIDPQMLVISQIEEEACRGRDQTKYVCIVDEVASGSRFQLNVTHYYTDLRLVFAPEQTMGSFGGDPDNFSFPRYGLDVAFLRAYENDEPARVVNHLPWSNRAPRENQAVFVSGNPGRTNRNKTVAQLQFERDYRLHTWLMINSQLRGRLLGNTRGTDVERPRANSALHQLENTFKANSGLQRALMSPEFLAMKMREEREIRQKLYNNKALLSRIGDPWADIDEILAKQRDLFLRYELLEVQASELSSLYNQARELVRISKERERPLDSRLPGYRTGMANLSRLADGDVIFDKKLEAIRLELWLTQVREQLGADDLAVRTLLANESPQTIAARAIAETKLQDSDARFNLLPFSGKPITASQDPLIVLALRADEDARNVTMRWNTEVLRPLQQAEARIAQAQSALNPGAYPQANFTVRLSYGRIKGLTGTPPFAPSMTRTAGYFERAAGARPFEATPSWTRAKSAMDPQTPFNVTSTNDTVGGNSGSALIDQNGDIIGVVFDGNMHALGGEYGFAEEKQRTISVTSVLITEALTKVYKADSLVRELTARPIN